MGKGSVRVGLALGAAFALTIAHPAIPQGGGSTLTVRVVGDGKVTSSPAGIDCPPDCSNPYPPGAAPQVVQLTAVPGAGQQLEAWGESCSGAGSCSVVMNADKVVTARFGAAPPPPPPAPPPSGVLTVEVTAGGDVTSAPAGIACRPDCDERLPLGSSFELSPLPHSAFTFERWEGACTGTGPCRSTVAERTYVRAVFAPVRTARTAGDRDADRDKVPDGRDACPGTPRGLKVRPNGCAALDVVRDADGALDPLREGIEDARRGLRNVPGLRRVRRDLGTVKRLLDRGDTLLGRGDVCLAAGQLRRAARRLGSADRSADKLIDRLQRDVLTDKLPPKFGDTAEKDVRWAELNLRRRLVDDAADMGATGRRLVDGACRAFKRRIVLRGVVTSTDDDAGVLRLGSGRRLLLAPLDRFGNRVFEGARVKIVAKGGTGTGPAIVDSVTTAAKIPAGGLKLAPCMQLRIAPFQDFFSNASPVVQDPLGYKADGKLWLEAGARLAASPKCATGKGRYSLAIELSGAGKTYTVAEDLTNTDAPAQLPVSSGPTLWTLTVHERRQLSNCPPPGASQSATAAKSYPCPVTEMSKTEYKVRILGTATYGTAVYNQTKFTLDVDAPAFVTATGLTGKHSSLPAGASFEGEGYKTTGTVNTGQYVTLKQGETWTLYPKQLYGFDEGLLFPLETFGVDHFAGLLWPRIVGVRNGKPFRYAAALPTIITDLLAFCPGMAEDCYYAPPWPFQVQYGVGQGNGPGFSHNGAQLYAFDFSMPDGAEIRAARGGIVGDVVDNLTKNYNPCDPATPNADGLGNYVRIDHQDGTYAYYVHLKTNTSPLQVGQEIGRGAVVAKADNTGRSCGAHLHFQVSTVNTQQYYGQTTRIRFETWLAGQASPYAQSCYIPQTGDTLISTNG